MATKKTTTGCGKINIYVYVLAPLSSLALFLSDYASSFGSPESRGGFVGLPLNPWLCALRFERGDGTCSPPGPPPLSAPTAPTATAATAGSEGSADAVAVAGSASRSAGGGGALDFLPSLDNVRPSNGDRGGFAAPVCNAAGAAGAARGDSPACGSGLQNVVTSSEMRTSA